MVLILLVSPIIGLLAEPVGRESSAREVKVSQFISKLTSSGFLATLFPQGYCTETRKQICDSLKKFESASFSKSSTLPRFAMGNPLGGDIWGKTTFEYNYTWTLVYFKREGESIMSGFGSYKTGNLDEAGMMRKYLLGQISEQDATIKQELLEIESGYQRTSFRPCKIETKSLVCQGDGKKFKEFLIRISGSKMYVFAFGLVPKMRDSHDSIPGFMIIEMRVLTNEPAR